MDEINIKAVEMVRQIRDKNYELLKNKSRAERIQFYREKARQFHAKLLEQTQLPETDFTLQSV
jgi:hypothetical protein